MLGCGARRPLDIDIVSPFQGCLDDAVVCMARGFHRSLDIGSPFCSMVRQA